MRGVLTRAGPLISSPGRAGTEPCRSPRRGAPEILKFIGDGLLAIFPFSCPEEATSAASRALVAAQEAEAAVRQIRHAGTEGTYEIVAALHIGSIVYGNIGGAARLDFTVIGAAVNVVSRVEGVAKVLNLPLVVTEAFAGAYGGPVRSIGYHALKGLGAPCQLFVPRLKPRRRPMVAWVHPQHL